MPVGTAELTPSSQYIYPESHWTYGLERNRRVWKFLRAVVAPIMKKKLHFGCDIFRVRSKKYIVLSNHATDYDPFMLGIMFPKYLRFICTEKLLRSRPWGAIISWLLNPIPRKKGASANDTVEYIKTNLRLGVSVAMFAEGGRTMNGRTGYISPNTGKLVKESSGGLITVRLSRGYLITPMWATKKRVGPTKGKVVREYSRSELDEMSVDEINAAIEKDLGYNVWEDQEIHRIAYRCKAPAMGLENALYVCPSCKRIGTMYGRGSDFICTCGYSVTMDKYGLFSNLNSQFENILDWDLWQRNYIASQIEHWRSHPEEPLCSDTGVTLYSVNGVKQRAQLGNATMTLYSDRIQFSAGEPLFSYRLSDIDKMNNYVSKSLLFTYQGRYYEISRRQNWPVFRYIALWRLLSGKEYY